MNWWPWSKTRIVKCPDGTTRIIYNNIDDAIPLHIKGWEASVSSKINNEYVGTGELDTQYKTKVDSLLIGLDDINNDIMMSFRSAYLGFNSNPCANDIFLLSQIEKINNTQHRLKTFRMQVLSFIEMIKINGNDNSEKITAVYCDLMSNMSLSEEYTKEIVVTEIETATKDAKKLMRERG